MRAKDLMLEALKRKKTAGGDCFVIAGHNMINSKVPDIKLVHAYVTGQGPLAGKRFPHAWNEIGDVVIDNSNGRNIVLRKEFYYDLGNVVVEPGQYAVYDKKQLNQKMLDEKTWGPWELDSKYENIEEMANAQEPTQSIEIPAGKSKKVKHKVPRYWYHNLGGRRLGPNGEILPYTYGKETKIFQDELFRDPKPNAFVYLSPNPIYSGAIKIDAAKLDPNLMRLTGQVEGNAIYAGPIPKEAQITTYTDTNSAQLVTEIKMAPNFLRAEAAKIDAKAGMEFEMLVPEEMAGSLEDEEEDFDEDRDITDLDDCYDFFVANGYNTHYTVARAIANAKFKFKEWKIEKRDDEWENEKEDYVREEINDDPPNKEDMLAILERDKDEEEERDEEILNDFIQLVIDEEPKKYSYYVNNAQERFNDNWDLTNDDDDLLSEFLIEEGIVTFQDFAQEYALDWPYHTQSAKGSLNSVAESFSNALGDDVRIGLEYHSAPRGNYYSLEPDSSVQPTKRGEMGMGLEFISPPKTIDQIINDLRKVREWALANGCYTNSTCGLHIGVSLPGRQSNVDFMKLAILVGDEYVLNQFGRDVGDGAGYAASVMQKISRYTRDMPITATNALEQIKKGYLKAARDVFYQAITSKNVSINPKGTYIEFRSPGGDWLGANFNLIEDTLNRFVVALDAAADPNKYRNEYLKKLYQLLKMPEAPKSNIDLFVRYVAGEISAQGLIDGVRSSRGISEPTKDAPALPNPAGDYMLNTEILNARRDDITESKTPKIGINVRNDGQIFYADMIVDGKKKLESRNSDSLRPYVNKRVAIVKTGAGPAQAIGEVTVGEPIKVDEKEFRRLEKQHQVPQASKFDIKPGSHKYLYPMINPVRYDTPKEVGKGIVSRKVKQK